MTKHNLDLQVITDNYFLILDEFPAVEVPKGFGEALTELVADKVEEAIARERTRIIELLETQEVIRRDSFGTLVFHNEGDLYAKDIEGLEPANG